MIRLRLWALVLPSGMAAAACSGNGSSQFVDHFDGGQFPGNGWVFSGPQPVLDTTAGDPAPSLTWVSCAGSNGAMAQVYPTFDGTYSFDARIQFQVYGSAASPQSGVIFHSYGDQGDDAAASILLPPSPGLTFELDGITTGAVLTTDGAFHQLEFAVDPYGDAVLLLDGNVVDQNGVASGYWVTELLCGEGNSLPGPIPVLFDNLDIEAQSAYQ